MRADLDMPAGVVVAELIPQAAVLLGEDVDTQPRSWSLAPLGSQPLDPELSLRDQGVRDGTVLALYERGHTPAPAMVEDFLEAVAIVVDARGGRWTAVARKQLLVATGVAWLAGGAIPLLTSGTATVRAWLGAGLAIVLLASGGVLARVRAVPVTGALVALAALPSSAICAAGLAALAAALPGEAVAAIAAGLAITAAAAAAVAPLATAPAAAVLATAVPLAVGAWVTSAAGGRSAQLAAALVVAWIGVLGWLPRLAARASGLGDDLDRATGDEALASAWERVAQARRLFVWLLVGCSAGITASAAVLCLEANAASLALASVAVLSLALRLRRYSFVVEILPPALASLLGAGILEAAVLRRMPSGASAAASAVAAVAATGAILVALGHRPPPSTPALRHRLAQLEVAANVALIPLALLILGVFGAVLQFGRRVG